MPEGDTIFRAARTLNRALAGRTINRFQTVYPHLERADDDTPITGRIVEEVTARGKYLLVRLSGDLILRTHMRMSGRWHLYRVGEPWKMRAFAARVVIGTPEFVAVAFNVPEARFYTARGLERDATMRALGPDLLADRFDEAEALRRMRAHAGRSIGETLLDQRVMAGAGNVFRSETLFLCGTNPFRGVESLSDEEVRQIIATVRRLLAANVRESSRDGIVTHPTWRRTIGRLNPGERLWVYSRAGKPCRRCGTSIASRKQGTNARVTYWCPACQP
jgi:endonuclease-8